MKLSTDSGKEGDFHTLEPGQLPSDPDAHLSPEAKAAIVCSIILDILIPPYSVIKWLIILT